MSIKLLGGARDVMQKLIENKSQLEAYVNSDLKGYENFEEILNYLKDNGLIESDMGVGKGLKDAQGSWRVKLSYEGLSYFEQEKMEQKPSQSVNFVGDGNVVQMGNDNVVNNETPKKDSLVKIIAVVAGIATIIATIVAMIEFVL